MYALPELEKHAKFAYDNTSSMQGSSATNQTMAALKRAQKSLLSENIKIASASASNPGIPPSSLMTFLEKVLDR